MSVLMKQNCLTLFLLYAGISSSVVLLGGCSNRTERADTFLKICQTLGDQPSDKETTFYLLIPVDGCSACMRAAIVFSKKNVDKSNFRAILVSKSGRKHALLSYGDTLPKHYFIDEKGLLFSDNFTNGLVTLLKLQENKIIYEKTYNPNEVDKQLEALEDTLHGYRDLKTSE